MSGSPVNYLDALYGEVQMDERIASLAAAPEVQRLRHVRLSNIDSMAMPGIANLSRYEHVLGVAHLASRIGLRRRISSIDHLALMAAALLHDWAITAFGHLVEEAFNYVSIDFDHEKKLEALLHGKSDGNTLGVGLQILAGRQTGLLSWARSVSGGGEPNELVERIGQLIRGKGPFGRIISGEMDLDNIDNVYRMAFHMGLPVDRNLPLRLAQAMTGVGDNRSPVFSKSATNDVEAWVETRRAVYSRLMPACPDFSLKIMIIWAATQQIRAHLLTAADWTLVDADFIAKLSDSPDAGVAETMARWKVGEAWEVTPLWWLQGNRPSFSTLEAFSEELSRVIARPCFAYGIKDKRERRLNFSFDDGSALSFGSEPRAWLFGVGSSKRASFSRAELEKLTSLATTRFALKERFVLAEDPMSPRLAACLL